MSLRHAILGFLAIRPHSGYDLKRTFDASVRHFWTADQAAIYRSLGDLEGEGLVTHERIEQRTRPDRKVFQITAAGVMALDQWLAQPVAPVPRREPLLVKLFFLSRLSPAALNAVLDAELEAVAAELSVYAGIVDSLSSVEATLDDATAIGPLVTLTNGVHYALAYREWLGRIREQAADGRLTAAVLLDGLRTVLAR